MNAPFDIGLQLERTLLSWRRTCLALAVGIAIAVRYSEFLAPSTSLWFGLPALGAVALAYLGTTRRYRVAHRVLASHPSALPTGGRAVTTAALVSFSLGIVALLFVLVRAFGS